MKPDFQRLMNQATLLTRSGDLRAATTAIQAALGGAATTGESPAMAPANTAPDVIDVVARHVVDTKTGVSDRFIAGRHSDGTAHRDYKLYIPPGAGKQPMPLVVMLHGCTQDPDDFARGTAMNDIARAQGFLVLYPAQSRHANAQGCWSWFKHNHQGRGRGEPALLASMTREVITHHAIDPDRVYVAGLSAGGAMAAILADAYPDIYAAVGVHSGLATGVAQDLPSALNAMKSGGGAGTRGTRGSASGVATIVFHGDADTTVHPINSNQIIMASAGMSSSVDVEPAQQAGELASTRRVYRTQHGQVVAEHWVVHGAEHAWSGGSAKGSYTEPRGPDASAEMVRFFMANPRRPSPVH